MNLSRRSLLAAALVATCAGSAGAQQGQPGTLVNQPKLRSTEDMPTHLGGKSVTQWIEEIKSRDPSRRENAIRTVVMLKGSEAAVPALLGCIDPADPDVSPRAHAIMALGAIPFSQKDDVSKIVTAVTKRLYDNQSAVKFQAALVLGRFGGKARPAKDDLIRASADMSSWEIRKAAVFSLTQAVADVAEPVYSRAIDALVARMSPANEPSLAVRLEAVMSIARIGKVSTLDHKKLAYGLATAEKDHDSRVAIWARVGLAVHDNQLTKEDISVLVKFLQSTDLPARTHAARAVGTIAALGNPVNEKGINLLLPAVPHLINMLRKDAEELDHVAAIWALGRIGPDAKAALPRLNEMLADTNISEEGKEFVKEALQLIQAKGKK
ncbi:MAG TPA: HEAT repeat domain-containing protein [Gemmataceae bacterium]|nr:HEAT repeat domain-containing protein [Gemmataceae bacterium]